VATSENRIYSGPDLLRRTAVQLLLAEDIVAAMNGRFEAEHPREIIRWALEDSDLEKVAMASSFQAEDTVVMDLAVKVRPTIPILFLETGFHFAETLAFKERLTELLGLNVIDLVGDHTVESQAEAYGPRMYEWDPDRCTKLNKVEPLNRALRRLDGWLTGLRRDSAPTRANAPIVEQYELEPGKTLVKFNPIANWTRQDVWRYLNEHDLPHHPLYDLGYASISCAPCTRMLFPGEDERAGRWSGTGKIECGIHESAEPDRVVDLSKS
jgi:phosphoadenosine phosphosulfate reductase